MYKPRTGAMAHQTAAIAACRAKPPAPCPLDVFAYLMDMGTGKSKVVLDEWGENLANGGPLDLLIVAPAGSYRNWYVDKGSDSALWSEVRKHLDPALLERTVVHGWKGGISVREKDSLKHFIALNDPRMPRVLVVNVEALSTVERAQELCYEFLKQRGGHMVLDESTTIKNFKSSRTKVAWELGELALSKRILSGLWTPKSPLDLFAQCYFLDQRIIGQANYFTFQRRYAKLVKQRFAGRPAFWQVVGYQNLDELQQRVAPYSYRVLKSDCLDLEPKHYTSIEVDLTPQQKKMINELKTLGHSRIGDTDRYVTTDMIIKQIIRITQIACGYVMDDEERVLHEVPELRTDALMGVLMNHRGKAIIWCPWRPPLEKIVRTISTAFGPKSVAQFHGGNKTTRAEEEHRFLNDPQCRFMCATQGAGMRGNTWTNANLTIYYANNYDLEQRDQSEDRNHRKGQTERVTYVDLLAPGTNDQKVVENLRKKIDLATAINNEGHRAWLI